MAPSFDSLVSNNLAQILFLPGSVNLRAILKRWFFYFQAKLLVLIARLRWFCEQSPRQIRQSFLWERAVQLQGLCFSLITKMAESNLRRLKPNDSWRQLDQLFHQFISILLPPRPPAACRASFPFGSFSFASSTCFSCVLRHSAGTFNNGANGMKPVVWSAGGHITALDEPHVASGQTSARSASTNRSIILKHRQQGW